MAGPEGSSTVRASACEAMPQTTRPIRQAKGQKVSQSLSLEGAGLAAAGLATGTVARGVLASLGGVGLSAAGRGAARKAGAGRAGGAIAGALARKGGVGEW